MIYRGFYEENGYELWIFSIGEEKGKWLIFGCFFGNDANGKLCY